MQAAWCHLHILFNADTNSVIYIVRNKTQYLAIPCLTCPVQHGELKVALAPSTGHLYPVRTL
jgi:hypothetical protein